MERVGKKCLCFLICIWSLCLWGCQGSLRVEDFRPYGFRAHAVIHREDRQERVLLSVSPNGEGGRDVSVEWLSPQEMSGLRVVVEEDRCLVAWQGLECDGGLMRDAVGDWDGWLSDGEWVAVCPTDYRGREAILVALPGEEDRSLYMDREGKIPLGMKMEHVEWEFLSYERMEESRGERYAFVDG